MTPALSRRDLLHWAALAGAALGLPDTLLAVIRRDPDEDRLVEWTGRLRAEGLSRGDVPIGRSAVRTGELAAGTPYEPGTLEAYLRAGGNPNDTEPLTLSLTHFDCVTLVESCLAVARVAGTGCAARGADSEPSWRRFGEEIERMRYRGGIRAGYSSRLHYFSEWISDGAARGLVRDLGEELGGVEDRRPLRFMSAHRASYPALTDARVFREIGAMEHRLDAAPRPASPRSPTGSRPGICWRSRRRSPASTSLTPRLRTGARTVPCGSSTLRSRAVSWR
jgi:hypothetical protein